MAPSNPKRPSRPRSRVVAAPKQPRPTLELPFDDGEVVVKPVGATRSRGSLREEAIPTAIYQIPFDEALQPPWDPSEVSDPGFTPAFLYVERGPGQGQLVPVKQGALVIGRSSVADLRLQHRSVSRRHAQLNRLGERFFLKDLGSQNGTAVNRVQVEAEVELFPGDELQVGSALLKLRGPAEKQDDATRKVALAEIKPPPRRSKPPAPRTSAAASRAVPSRNSGALVAAACLGIGFGLCALGLLAYQVMQGQPRFEPLPSSIVVVEASVPVVTPTPAEAQREMTAERIARQLEQARAEVAAEPTAEQPAPPAERPAPVVEAMAERPAPKPAERPAPRPAPAVAARAERAPMPVSRPDPAPRQTAAAAPTAAVGKAAILKLYEQGEVAEAIRRARGEGQQDLAQKLSDFQRAHAAAQRAEKANDAAAAVGSYKQALKVDEQISGGWGAHGPAISKRLGIIYTRYGQHLLKQGEQDQATQAFKEALKYDPQDQVAKKHLAQQAPVAQKPAAPPAPSRARRAAAIDDAWSTADPQAVKQQRRSAIDEAWGD